MPNTSNLDQMFRWQARVGLAPKFGSRPIGCSITSIVHTWSCWYHLTKKAHVPSGSHMDFEVRTNGSRIQARAGGAPRGAKFHDIGTFDEIRRRAEHCAMGRKDRAFAGFRGGR